MPDTPQVHAPRASVSVRVLALSSGNALSLLAGIIAAMVAARLLSKQDYATIRQTFLAYEIVSPLLLLGLPNALYYLIPRAGADRKSSVIDSIGLLTGAGALFAGFLILGGDHFLARQFDNPSLEVTLPWLGVYALAMMPVAAIGAVLVLADRVIALTLYNVAVSFAIAGGNIAAMLFTRSFEYPVAARIAVAVLALPAGVYLMLKASSGQLRLPQATQMVAMLRYSTPIGIAFMFGAVTLQVHALIVSLLCTPEEFAVYINGAVEIPLISVVVGSITTVILADMSEACARGEKRKALELFKNSTVKASYILFPATVYFAISAKPFIVFLYSDKYIESVTPFLIYLLVVPARIAVYGSALMALGMNRIVLIRSVLDILVLSAISLIFVYLMGYNGAAFGLVISLYFFTIPYCLYYIGKGYDVTWRAVLPWRRLADSMAMALVCAPLPALAIYFLDGLPGAIQLAVSSVLYGLLYGTILQYRGLLIIPESLRARLFARGGGR